MKKLSSDKIVHLFNSYKGQIKLEKDMISFISINTLYHTYNDEIDGKLIFHENKPKKVECKIVITINDDGTYFFDAEEKTLEILGGFSTLIDTFEELQEYLSYTFKHYNFKKKNVEQLYLF